MGPRKMKNMIAEPLIVDRPIVQTVKPVVMPNH